MTTPRDNPLPEWLPTDMRHTATPSERLYAVLRSMSTLLDSRETLLLRARAWKAQHLCLQINADACVGPERLGLTPEEAGHLVHVAAAFLSDPETATRPPASLVYTIHQCAMTLATVAGQSASRASVDGSVAARAATGRDLKD